MNLGIMVLKGYFTFRNTSQLETHYQMVKCRIRNICWGWGVLLLCGYTVGIFYIPADWSSSGERNCSMNGDVRRRERILGFLRDYEACEIYAL